MQYTNLGSTGLIVSRICLGMMTYGSKKWRQWVLEEGDAMPFVNVRRRAVGGGVAWRGDVRWQPGLACQGADCGGRAED